MDIPTQDMPVETWHTLIDLNLTSTFVCTKLLGGAMIGRGRGGRIINIASISGMIANRGIGGRSYETGKAAVIAFTRAVAADWAPHRITVNAIAPGGVVTNLHTVTGAVKDYPAFLARGRETHPLGFVGALGFARSGLAAETDSTAGRDFFEARIRPVLVEHCIECHGPQKQESGLRLDTREALFKGGDGGAAVVAGRMSPSAAAAALLKSTS